MRLLFVIFFCLLCLPNIDGYRILAVWPYNSKSHFGTFEVLAKALADKGHQIDVISPILQKIPYPNYTDLIVLPKYMMTQNNVTYNTIKQNMIYSDMTKFVAYLGNAMCAYLGFPEFQKLLHNPPNDPPYNAVIIEALWSQCFAVIGHLWNVPTIGISTTMLFPWLQRIIGQPENLALVPINLQETVSRMNFWQRLYNVLYTRYNELSYDYYTRKQNDMLKKYFGADIPSVQELELEISMILLNTHFTVNGIMPMMPAVIEVGGLHIRDDDSQLQPELEKWMNDSKYGFVYFTFGSMVLIESFPREFLNVLYSSLGKIAPVRVLMKVPNPDKLPANLPKNIYTFRWVSQLKVLRHPNIKAFITHGGIMGTQEAILYGVPMIGIPLYYDQFININSYVTRNIAVKLDVDTMTEKDLDDALNAVLRNPKYRESVQNLSKRFQNRPMKSVDTAIYWIEYVIKYGSNSLRSPAMDLTWWQLAHIDIIIFLVFFVTIIIIVLSFLMRLLIKTIRKSRQVSLHSKKIN